MGGTLGFFFGSSGSRSRPKKKLQQLQTVEIKVRMDCEGCERKIKKALYMKGVQSVDINMKQQKVTVIGYVEQSKVLQKVQSTGKKAQLWPYVPYNLVPKPFIPEAYDKKAPPGYVKKVDAVTFPDVATNQEEQLAHLFDDENPNSCSMM